MVGMNLLYLVVAGLASWGLVCLYGDVCRWVSLRFELDRGSPWVWRVRRRWYRPGAWLRVPVTENCRGEYARVVDIDSAGPRVWVNVCPYVAGKAQPSRWLPLSAVRLARREDIPDDDPEDVPEERTAA